MDSERGKRKTLLYADLFKSHKNLGVEEQKNCMISDGSSVDSSSSSSGFSTPFDSELGSFGSEDEEFMEELTRQMAECMLKEEAVLEQDQTTKAANLVHQVSGPVKNQYMSQRYMESSHFYPEHQMSNIQVYQLKNQPPVRHGKKSGAQYRGKRKGNDGSGMKAIFLGEYGSGSSNGSSGTGVFLPRSPNDPSQVKKKSVCSTVLIPTRVLQTLELHYNRVSTSKLPVSSGENRDRSNDRDKCTKFQHNSDSKLDNWVPKINDEDEMHLPQEWTY